MAPEALVSAGQGRISPPVPESEAWSLPGVRLLVTGIVTMLAGIAVLVLSSVTHGNAGLLVLGILLLIGAGLQLRGLTAVVVGEARVVQLFGQYRGTIRTPGLRWVNPVADKRRVSVRIRNHETTVAKVNDADGNPIEIAAVVVWQVLDTSMALYAVDDYPKFI